MRLGDFLSAARAQGDSSFNSSLVRLGVQMVELQPLKLQSFNSSLVRLGVLFALRAMLFLFRFNSSLVRLGGKMKMGLPERIGRVSIPAWCDWEFLLIN